MPKVFSRYLVVSLLICVVFSALPKALSDENPDISHVKAGFSVRPSAQSWSEVTVSISNPGEPRELEVTIFGQGRKIGAERVLCRRPVYLPAKSTRWEKFYAPFGQVSEIEVQLHHEDVRIDRDSFPVKAAEVESPIFLIVGELGGSYSSLSKFKIPGFEGSPVPVPTQPRYLPEKWIGYDGVDVALLGGFRQENLNGHQVKALKQWIAAGGTLIISSGEQYDQYRNSFVEEIMDIRVLGVRKVTNLPSMVEHFDSEIGTDRDFYLTEVDPRTSRVIVQEGQVPLILASDYGSGKVIFLGFDASHESLMHWDGANALWSELVGTLGAFFPEERTILADNIERILMEVVGIEVPEFGKVGVLLLSYLGLIIISYLFFRHRKRPELAWLIYPVVVPISIWMAYQVGQVGKGETGFSVTEVSVTELSRGNGEGTCRGYLGFYAPGGLAASLTFSDGTVYGPRVSRAMPERAPFRVIEVYQEDLFTLKDVTLDAGTLRTLAFNSIVSLGEGIDTRMTLTRQGLVGEITNRTGQQLDGCLLVYNRHVKPIGSLRNGETVRTQLADPACSSWGRDYSQSAMKSKEEATRERIISSLYTAPFMGRPVKSGFVFWGWLSRPALGFDTIDGEPRRDALALLLTKVPVDVEERDTILIPKGICRAEPASRQTMLVGGKWLRNHRGGEAMVDFILPDVCRGMMAKEIKVYFQFDATDMDVKLAIYNWEEERWFQLGGGRQISLSEARPYLSEGKVRMKVTGRPTRELSPESIFTGFWEIRDLDVELRGDC